MWFRRKNFLEYIFLWGRVLMKSSILIYPLCYYNLLYYTNSQYTYLLITVAWRRGSANVSVPISSSSCTEDRKKLIYFRKKCLSVVCSFLWYIDYCIINRLYRMILCKKLLLYLVTLKITIYKADFKILGENLNSNPQFQHFLV